MEAADNPYKRSAAIGAYTAAKSNASSPVEIVVMLYEAMLRNIEGARVAYEARDLATMCRLNQKTFKILMALQTNLDFERGGTKAQALNQFYTAVFLHLSQVLTATEPSLTFRHISGHVRDVCEFWRKVADREQKALTARNPSSTDSATRPNHFARDA